MKGITIIVEALLLVVIAIALSLVIGNWVYSVSTEKASTIKNTTSQQLKCEFGNLFIKSASYDCSKDCSVGKIHNLTLNVVNSGKITVKIDRLFIQNAIGTTFSLDLNETIFLDPGSTNMLTNLSTDSCSGINNTIDRIVVSSINCPNTAFDSLPGNYVAFINC